MILIIDAYNLIKQISGIDFVTEGLRQKFIDRLVRYAQAKSLEILLVFDGGDGFQYTRKPVTVFYSGQVESADDLIQELLASFASKAFQAQILLVTCDRELLNVAQAVKISSLSVTQFYKYLLNFEIESNLVKTDKTSYNKDICEIYSSNNLELNKLMLADELDVSELKIKEFENQKNNRQLRGQAVSKRERQLKKKTNKL